MVAILDMPESPAELGEWLDRVLMSGHLAKAVDELSAVHQAASEEIDVEQARKWLGDSFPAVMQRGLGELSRDQLRAILVRPSLLPALQELALCSGEAYWDRLASRDHSIDDHLRHVAALDPTGSGRRWLLALVPLAVAASIVGFIAIDAGRERGIIKPGSHSDLTVTRGTDGNPGGEVGDPDQPWGWNRLDVMDELASPAAIPERLAESLSEWFPRAKAADSDLQLFTLRVNELWAGCEQMGTQPLAGVSPDLQRQIRNQIDAFQAKLEGVLADLDREIPEGQKSLVLAAAKKTIDSSVSETAEALRSLK